MSKRIQREGDFVGYAMQSGTGKTKTNNYPQLVAQFQAVQELDPDSGEFIDITNVEEVEITGYFILFGKDNAILPSAKQIKEAYPHLIPMSTRKLNDADLSEIPVKFRVEEREYKGKKKLEVTEITNVDGTLYGGGGVTKADDATVDVLDAKYAAAFRELNGGDKPAAVPAAKKVADKKAAGKPVVPRAPVTATKVAAAEETDTTEPTNKELMKDMAKASVDQQKERAAEAEYNAKSPAEKKMFDKKKKAKALKAKADAKATITKPKIPTVSKPAAPLEEPTATEAAIDALDLPASCTQDEAWETCETNAVASKADLLTEAWTEVVQEFGDDVAVEANKAWAEVRTKVLERVIDEN